MTRPFRLYAAMLALTALACALPSALPVDPPPDEGREYYRGVYGMCMYAFVTRGGYGKESAAIICDGMLEDARAAEIHVSDAYGWEWEPRP